MPKKLYTTLENPSLIQESMASTPLMPSSPKVMTEEDSKKAKVVLDTEPGNPSVEHELAIGSTVVTEEKQAAEPTIELDKTLDKNEPKDDAKTTDKKKLPLRWMNHIIGGIDDIGKAISDAVQNMFISIYNQINFFSRWGKDVPDEDTDLTAGKKGPQTKSPEEPIGDVRENANISKTENNLPENKPFAELTAPKQRQETPAYDAFATSSLPTRERAQRTKKISSPPTDKSDHKRPHP